MSIMASGRRSRGAGSVRWKLAAAFAAALVVLGIIAPAAHSEEPRGDEIGKTRAALSELVAVRKQIATAKFNAALASETLTQQIDVVQREVDQLGDRMKEIGRSIQETERSRAEAEQDHRTAVATSQCMANIALRLEDGTRRLLKRLPERTQAHLAPLSQKLPTSQPEKFSVAERFANVVGILNELNKIGREVAVVCEVRKLPSGQSIEVETMYVGLGHAYYANNSGTVAGIGFAGPDGWAWKQADESAGEIAKAIKVFKNEHVACFVNLPVHLEPKGEKP